MKENDIERLETENLQLKARIKELNGIFCEICSACGWDTGSNECLNSQYVPSTVRPCAMTAFEKIQEEVYSLRKINGKLKCDLAKAEVDIEAIADQINNDSGFAKYFCERYQVDCPNADEYGNTDSDECYCCNQFLNGKLRRLGKEKE